MRLDDLSGKLRACHAAAGSSLRLDASLLRAAGLRSTGSVLGRLRAWLLLDLALNTAAAFGLVGLIPARLGDLGRLSPALLLGAFAGAQALFGARQLRRLGRVDLSGPEPARRAGVPRGTGALRDAGRRVTLPGAARESRLARYGQRDRSSVSPGYWPVHEAIAAS